MYTPLICTANSYGHVDYGIPIVANKSTDYRTSTGKNHQFIPNKPQEFDCRAKLRAQPHLLVKDVAIRDDVKTGNSIEYVFKKSYNDPLQNYQRAPRAKNVSYGRNIQERLFDRPPRPMEVNLSETKDEYRFKKAESSLRQVFPPEPYEKCEIQSLGRDEQSGIPPELPGYSRRMDPYLTTSRAQHVPFTVEQQNGIARKDIITIFDTLQLPKAKGFGPKNMFSMEPLVSQRQKPTHDRLIFKRPMMQKLMPKKVNRVPNLGAKSEAAASYGPQTYSDLQPYLHSPGVEFPDSLPEAGAWQNLPAPGMYCTECCHIGTGWPLPAIVDPGLPKKYMVHKPCYIKFHDNYV